MWVFDQKTAPGTEAMNTAEAEEYGAEICQPGKGLTLWLCDYEEVSLSLAIEFDYDARFNVSSPGMR